MALRDDAEELGGILGQIKTEMENFKSYADQSDASFKNLISAAEQFKSVQQGSSKLSAEQLKTLSDKIKKEKENLLTLQSSLKAEIESEKIAKKAFESASQGLGQQIKSLENKRRLTNAEKSQLESLKSTQAEYTKNIQESEKFIEQNAAAYDRVTRAVEDADGSIKQMQKDLEIATGKAEIAEGFQTLGALQLHHQSSACNIHVLTYGIPSC